MRKIKKKTTSHFDSDTPKRNNNTTHSSILLEAPQSRLD